MKKIIRIGLTLLAVCATQAFAADYPSKPVRFIIAFPPGSATDVVGRLYTQKLSEYWGKTVIPDNRGGAGGSIGAAIAARAAPDGYTLLMNSSAHAVNPSIFAKLPYDTLKDFIDIGPLAQQPNVLVVPPGSPYKSPADMIAAAKSKSLNLASAGVGSGTHLNLEKFAYMAKIKINHIAYKGSGEALTDVIGGRVDGFFAPISAGIGHIQAGKARALAVSTIKRSSALPNIPTIAESGIPNFDFSLWFGIWAPTGTPPAIVNKIAQDTKRAGIDLKDKLVTLGNDPMDMTPAQFAKFVREEIATSAVVLKAAGIKPQ